MKRVRRANGEGTIYYSQTRDRYIAQYNLGKDTNGKLKRKTIYATTRKEAYEKLIEMQMKHNAGIYTDLNSITITDWIKRWFETYKIHDYKISTYEKEYHRANRIFNSKLGMISLDEVNPIDVQEFINDLNLNPKSIKNIFILLNGAMKQAVAERYILSNPCDYVSLPKVIKTDMVAMDMNEKQIFLEHAKNNPYYDVFSFALNTGMREAEICGLTKDCIDLSNGYINVKQQLLGIKGEYIIDTPKTNKSIRRVPMNETVRNILEKNMHYTSMDFIFGTQNTNSFLKPGTLMRNIKKVYSKCYIATNNEVFNKSTFHTLRHTFATNWVVQGGNVALLSKILGHTDASFTMRVYVQPSDDDTKKELLRIL